MCSVELIEAGNWGVLTTDVMPDWKVNEQVPLSPEVLNSFELIFAVVFHQDDSVMPHTAIICGGNH
jgi:hypothetical protein